MYLKFNPKQEIVFPELLRNEYDEILLDGGSRSGKTFLVCMLLDYWCRIFRNEGLRILICRSKLIDCKATILEQTFIPILQNFFAGFFYRTSIENSIVVYHLFNSEIWCSGWIMLPGRTRFWGQNTM